LTKKFSNLEFGAVRKV